MKRKNRLFGRLNRPEGSSSSFQLEADTVPHFCDRPYNSGSTYHLFGECGIFGLEMETKGVFSTKGDLILTFGLPLGLIESRERSNSIPIRDQKSADAIVP